jgi:hypothetical protein
MYGRSDRSQDGQALDLEEAEVNGTRNALDKRKGSLYWVARESGLAGPFIKASPGKIANDALAPGIEHSIDDGVEVPISPIADHQVLTVLGGLFGEWKCFPLYSFRQISVFQPAALSTATISGTLTTVRPERRFTIEVAHFPCIASPRETPIARRL